MRRHRISAAFCQWIALLSLAAAADAQPVLYDFNDAALLHASLPLDITRSNLTAHLSATGNGYSIQDPMQTILMLPAGFSGYSLSPNSVFLADLLVRFDVPLSAFSLIVAPQVLACDTTATLRVTGYLGATFVATATASATTEPPYMWPSSTLSLSAAQGFDHLVIHYDAAPPPPCDYGVIFVADDMTATANNVIFADGFEAPLP